MEFSRRSIGAGIAFFGLAAATTSAILVLASDEIAGAVELERFSSCAELEAWTADAVQSANLGGADGGLVGAPAARGAAEATTALAVDDAGGAAGGGTGGTNTVVAGVDEIDITDRVGEDRLIVSRNGTLSLVDLADRVVVDHLDGAPWDARVSVDGDLVWVAGSARQEPRTEVLRVRVDGDRLVSEASWSTPGYLLDARRTGDRLHVVTVDQPWDGGVPFEGGPVPCDQVWRPTAQPTTPAATLVATLPADGELAPVAAAEVVGAAGTLLVTDASVYIATETWAETEVITGVHRFDLDGLAPTGSGSVPGHVAGPFALDEHDGYLRVATSAGGGFGRVVLDDAAVPEPEPTNALAEVFVLDTDGVLDIVGRTGRFGHDGETIHGVRFLGDVAYVVTFLNTDPFWVLDLRDPAAPAVVGELEIPGFSAYLHPAGDGRVVGFGPDGAGQVAARLFDVSDPAAPALLDEQALGQDSPVVWDHHAYVALDGGRFAVPVTEWPQYVEERCPPVAAEPEPRPVEPDAGIGGGTDAVAPCVLVTTGGRTGAAVLGVDGDRLTRPERAEVATDGSFSAERVVLAPDGTWLLVGYDRIVPTDGGEPIVLPAEPGVFGEGVVVD